MDIHPTAAVRLPATEWVDDWAYVEEPSLPRDLDYYLLRPIVDCPERLTPAQERRKADRKAQGVLRERDRERKAAEKAERALEREQQKAVKREQDKIKRWWGKMKPPPPCRLCGFPLPREKAVCPACIVERDRAYREMVTAGYDELELPDGTRIRCAPSQMEQFRREAIQHRMDVSAWAMHRLGLG